MVEIQDKIDFVLGVILKEARLEDRLARQLFYTMLSTYTQNPVNLAINAPPGEGKTYVINKVADNFPCKDVLILAGMTEKALFHKQGRLVIRNETTSEYEDIEPKVKEMKLKKLEIETNKALDDKTRKSQLFELDQERKELLKDAKKLILLHTKVLIFLDTPKEHLFEALMPLLSHDKYEVEYEYVDTHAGITTRTNIIRGWPSVIFAQAKDASRYDRWPEIQRRFIMTNPKMDEEKYKQANEHTATKYGMPDLVYQVTVVRDSEKLLAQKIVLELKETILDLTRSNKPGKNNVLIPFNKSILSALPSSKAYDMTTHNRFFNYTTLLPIVNSHKRPRLKVVGPGGRPEIIPLAVFEDLRETMSLMDHANGLRPYISDWYVKVFLPTYSGKKVHDKKGEKEEQIVAVTTKQLIEETFAITKKKLSNEQILQTYLYPLLNENYIDKADSEIDGRAKIYYPVDLAKNTKLFNGENGDAHKIPVSASEVYPDKGYLVREIEQVIGIYRDNGYSVEILAPDGTMIATVTELVERHYSGPERYFALKARSRDEYLETSKIAKEFQSLGVQSEPAS